LNREAAEWKRPSPPPALTIAGLHELQAAIARVSQVRAST